jgi:hypothetical protein
MAFCSNCGNQLQGDERFCVKCGHDVKANGTPAEAASTPVAGANAPAVTPAVAAQPIAAAPPYAAPGPIPVAIGMPPVAVPQKNNGLVWAIVLLLLLGGGYYYYNKNHQQTPPQGNAPAQPGTAPSSGAAPQPGVPVQPGDPGPGGQNASLVQMQHFSGQWRVDNGSVEVYNLAWTNGSNVVMQSAVLECDQYDASNGVLAQNRTTLNGPVQPGGVGRYNAFTMGTAQQGLKAVNCAFVAATPAS